MLFPDIFLSWSELKKKYKIMRGIKEEIKKDKTIKKKIVKLKSSDL